MKSIITKIVEKKVYEKFGYRINIQLNDVQIDMIDGEIKAHLDVDAKMNKSEFNRLIEYSISPDDLIYKARDVSDSSESSILYAIKEDEKAYIINVQLVDAIKCSKDTLHCSLTTGRNAVSLYSTVRKAIGLDGAEKFTFGNIRRSRTS